MWSPYVLAIACTCGLGSIWILWCAIRDLGRALRSAQIRGRGGVIYERNTSPFSYWLCFLSAVWFFAFLEAFIALLLVAVFWLVRS